MTETSPSHPRWLMAAVIVGVAGVVFVAAAFPTIVSPPEIRPASTVEPTTLTPSLTSLSYWPEILPPFTYTPPPARTSTPVPTHPPIPTPTPFLSPTVAMDSAPLPDLIVTGIGDPICLPDRKGTMIEISIFIRNNGRAGTRSFGSFRLVVLLLMGQQRYSLDEWARYFHGVVGVSPLEVSSLNPQEDRKFMAVIDLKGNKDFGIEVIANAGENPIREADRTNNTLIKYFSRPCP